MPQPKSETCTSELPGSLLGGAKQGEQQKETASTQYEDGWWVCAFEMCSLVSSSTLAGSAQEGYERGAGGTYFVDADLSLHILEPFLEDGDECSRWH